MCALPYIRGQQQFQSTTKATDTTMNVSVLATDTSKPACWDAPEVFSSLALDYDPNDEDYTHLDPAGHAAAAEDRRTAEEAAVNVCYDCPLMLACEEMDAKASAIPGAVFVHGVIGGLTEDERLARLGRRRTAATVAPANPQIAPGDRGPRKQVDDALVARLTLAGRTGDQIAHELQCAVRTVTRARKRMTSMLTSPLIVENNIPAITVPVAAESTAVSTAAPIAATTPVAPSSVSTCAPQSTRKTRRTRTTVSAGAVTRHPFLNGRPISPAMEAVYDHLSRNGETAFADLKNLAAIHIDDAEALEWWLNRNSTTEDGNRVIRPSKANLSGSERIREGALAKAHNAIDAAVRAGRYLSKDSDSVALIPAALDAWRLRMTSAAAA